MFNYFVKLGLLTRYIGTTIVPSQLGTPNMKIPIQYALTYPNHLKANWDTLNLAEIGNLTFEEPDLQKFPCIRLAYDSLKEGGTFPIVLNVANDSVVHAFLNNQIHFTDIPNLIENALKQSLLQNCYKMYTNYQYNNYHFYENREFHLFYTFHP